MGDSIQKAKIKLLQIEAYTITIIYRNCFVILMKTQKQNITLNDLNKTFRFLFVLFFFSLSLTCFPLFHAIIHIFTIHILHLNEIVNL